MRNRALSYAEAIDTMPELVGYIQVAHSLNLRARPSMYARIKDVLKPFTQVIILDTMGKWTEILTEKFHGFVASKYIHSGE